MKFKIKEWSVLNLYEKRDLINFPVYQRKEVWSDEKKALLVDSILAGIDIPKIYLQKTKEGWDCIDGQQRINAVLDFFDNELKCNKKLFQNLNKMDKKTFEEYNLTIAEVKEISEKMVRELFKRLQLGVPLNAGEKLNAIKSNLGDFVKIMTFHPFIKNIGISIKRYSKELACAQICNNSRYIKDNIEFRNSKYDDLENLYTIYADFDLKSNQAKSILFVLDKLKEIFSAGVVKIRNRASVVSIYLLAEEMIIAKNIDGKEKDLKNFYLDFLEALKKEVRLGVEFKNKFLLAYQNKVIQAADISSAIEYRHKNLCLTFSYYLKHRKIIGYSK